MASYFCTFRSTRSPPRKRAAPPDPSDVSTNQVPFRSANPEQLQEVTLGTQLEYPEGGAPAFLRSSAGCHSPIRTRTMKEYDQQIAELKKENFSLKLRIYFLEERWEHKFPNSSEDVFKSNIELKVEVESLKKELSDKQELLVKASNALEALEATHGAEIEDLRQQFANQRLALEQQIFQFQQAVTGFHNDKCEQSNSDDGSQVENYEQAISSYSEPLSKHFPLLEELNAKVFKLESEVEQLNKDLTQSQETVKDLEKLLGEKEALIKQEDINNIKRNKLIQGLVETVKTKDKQLVQIQEKLDLQESELKKVKSELNEKIKLLQEKPTSSDQFAPSSSKNRVAESETHPNNDGLEDLRKEKERLEAAWRDAVRQRDETIQDIQDRMQLERHKSNEKIEALELHYQTLQADLHQQLQFKEEQLLRLKQALEDRESVIGDCLQLVGGIGLDDLEAAKDLSVHNLSQKLKSKIKEKENSVQAVLEDKLKLLKEKDNELTQLRESLREKDYSQNEKFMELKEAQEVIFKLQSELQERDTKIQELMDTIQNLYKQVEEIHESNARTIAEKDTVVQRLQKSLVSTEKKLESLESNSQSFPGQQQDELVKLKMSLDEKENTIKTLLTEMAEKDKELHQVISNVSISNIQELEKETLKLRGEIVSLHAKLQGKEGFLVYLKEYLENLLNESSSPVKGTKEPMSRLAGSSHAINVPDTSYLEQKLADLKARLKDSRIRNQQLEAQLASVNSRLAAVTPNRADKFEDEVKVMCGGGDNSLLTYKDHSPRNTSQITNTTALGEIYNEVFVPDAQTKETSPLKKGSALSKSQPALLDRRMGKSNIPVRLKPGNQPTKGSNHSNYFAQYQATKAEIQSLTTKLASTENTVHMLGMKLKYYRKLLQDAGIVPLASPGSRSLSCLLPASCAISERRLSFLNYSGIPKMNPIRRSVSAEDLSFGSSVPGALANSNQALSAEDVLTTHTVKTSSEKRSISEKVTEEKVKSTETVQLRIKIPALPENVDGSCQTTSPFATDEKCLSSERVPVDISRRTGMEIPLTPIVIDLKKEDCYGGLVSSPYTPDSVVDYGQSNDTLELKEQICRLKLQLDQRDAELQFLRCKYTKDAPFPGKEKSDSSKITIRQCFGCVGASEDADSSKNSPFILQEQLLPPSAHDTPDGNLDVKIITVDAACQVEETVPCRQSNDQDLLDALAAEIEHLQDKNVSLNSKLESLIQGIPEGKLKNFIQLQQQEANCLKKRLLESHNACEMLRGRLEELADFLEHLLQFDENGLLDTSQLTPQRIASLHHCIAQSRELSLSLSHSLLVDVDISVLSNFDKTNEQASITLPFPECTLTSEEDQHILQDLSKIQTRISKNLESSAYSSVDVKSHRKSQLSNSSHSLQDLMDNSELNVSMELSNSHFKKIQKENCEKTKLIGKLRNQVRLLQEQIRQRDIEHAWNNLDNTLTETSQASYPTTNDHQSAKVKKRTNSGHKLLHQTKDIIPISQSLSSIEGKPCPAVSADCEFVWQSQLQTDSFDTNSQHRSAPHTPANHSSCDDLILLLRAERDVPSRQSCAPSHHSQEQNVQNGHLADELANCEMRTLEALQEQAIMAEYVRHYTTRQFLDEDIHHRVPQRQQPSTIDLPEKEKPQKLRSRHIPSPTDSDSWSEPDRDVSQQRMGIDPEDHSTSLTIDRWRSPRSLKHPSNNRIAKINSSSEDLSQQAGSRIYRTSVSPGAVSTSQGEQKDVQRLQSRLQSLEELNATLRSELQLYKTLDAKDIKKSFLKTQESCSSSFSKEKPVRRKSTGSAVQTQAILQEHLLEIRILRSHLEASIKTNEHLRDKLDQKLTLQQEYVRSGKSMEVDKLYEVLQQKEQEISDLQEQLEYYRKLAYTNRKTEQEKTARQQQQQQQISELKEHIQSRQEQMEQLQKELSDREQASSELKQAMQRLQGSTLHLQTALNDKELVNRELREANSRMQRTLDTVDQLMSQREKEMQNILSQRDKLKGSMQELLKKQEAEVAHLNKKILMKEKDLIEQKKALDDLSELNVKIQRHSDKSQEEILHLHKSLANKEDVLNRETKRIETLQTELSKKAQDLQMSQKKCDDLMVALSETERLLEQEHGLSLTLQQKVNALNMTVTEKENASASLHQRIHDLDSQLHKERISVNELKKSVEEYKLKYKESQCQVTYLQSLVEKLKVTNADRKREQELQLEKIQILEKQLKETNASAKDYEQKYQKERSFVTKLQEQSELLKKQSSNLETEVNNQRIACEKLRQQLHEQEKIYFDLQTKLDERSATIHKLEEEVNQTMEENYMLHQEVLTQQSKLKEATDLNKSMKTELNVYEHLHASIISQRNASNPDKAVDPEKKLHLEELLEEIRNLRSQLELSIQTNNALRSQLEEQFKAELKAFSSIKFQQEFKEINQLISLNGNKMEEDGTENVLSPLRNPQRSDPKTDGNSALQQQLMELSHSIQSSRPVSRISDKVKAAANHTSLLSWNELEVNESNDRNKSESESLKKESSQSSQLRQCSQSSDYVSDPTTEEFLLASSDTTQKITVSSLTLLPDITCIDREILAPGSSPHSMYSSPDLGIESDPNHFSSLERKHSQALREIKQTSLTSSKNIPAMELSYSIQGPFRPSDDPKSWIDSDRRLLFAIGRLDDYELLKREVEEGIIVLKGIQARIKERMKSCPSSSPLKNMEFVTLKEIQNGSNNLQICLGKSSRVIGHFWTAMLPSSIEENDENHRLIEENTNLKRKLRQQKKTLQDAFQKLAATNRLKEGMEKAIIKQLTKTHDVLKKAKGNLTDQTNCRGEQLMEKALP